MSMTMAMGSMPSSTMTSMSSKATSTTSVDMGMDMGMSSSGMSMVFFTATDTALYSSAWAPSTTGQYAGTCIFLILLTVIFRSLLALKSAFDRTTTSAYFVGSHHRLATKEAHIREEGLGAELRSVWAERPPWRMSVEGWRAILDMTIVGVGYLLYVVIDLILMIFS